MLHAKPTHLDLFSGIGGFSLAFEAEGFETIGFSEIDPYASQVLKRHWPHVPNYGNSRNISKHIGLCPTVITGGVPCQPASTLGKKRGSDDVRWEWPEAFRIVSELLPRFALFENPTGILSVNRGASFNRILSEFHALGYDAWWETIPACAFGTDQERNRVCIVLANTASGWSKMGLHLAGVKRKKEPFAWNFAWPTENSPLGMGVFDDVPKRLDRLRCLGNSITPPLARIFANAFKRLI